MLYLEERQSSPRATVVISLRDEAEAMGLDQHAFEAGLNVLLNLDYIEGPGADIGGTWLFRRLSQKGAGFVKAVRAPSDWERMKARQRNRVLDTGSH